MGKKANPALVHCLYYCRLKRKEKCGRKKQLYIRRPICCNVFFCLCLSVNFFRERTLLCAICWALSTVCCILLDWYHISQSVFWWSLKYHSVLLHIATGHWSCSTSDQTSNPTPSSAPTRFHSSRGSADDVEPELALFLSAHPQRPGQWQLWSGAEWRPVLRSLLQLSRG